MSMPRRNSRFWRGKSPNPVPKDRRGVVALEFAILAIPFFVMVLGVFEISYDMFMQEATDMALQAGARQMEVGNSYGTANESTFLRNYVCNTTAGRLLECANFHIKAQVLQSTDRFDTISSGTLPMAGHALDLSTYDDTSTKTVFCNAPPGSLILVSAVYVGPSFLFGLMPYYFNETYGGYPVHAVLSQVGVASENFSASGTGPTCS